MNVFFLTDQNKRDTGLDKPNVAAAPIKSVGVLGSGIMGGGITGAVLKSEAPVALTDANAEAHPWLGDKRRLGMRVKRPVHRARTMTYLVDAAPGCTSSALLDRLRYGEARRAQVPL